MAVVVVVVAVHGGGNQDVQHHDLLWRVSTVNNCLVGLVVKASVSRAEDPASNPAAPGFFRGRLQKLALQWLPCQAPGVIGSVLGLVGPVLVYCEWVRWKVGSATSISVWHHVKLSEQIRS